MSSGWDDNSFGNNGFESGGGFGSSSNTRKGGFGGNKSVTFPSRPTTNNNSSWKPKVKEFETIGNLNKMISVHNIPFFGQTQAFMGKTMWDWFKRPKANFSDIIDRLNCHIVPMFLIFFVMLISANIFGAFGMEPMKCLRSPELNEEERDYALDYCQSKNTYYVAPEEGIPWSNKERRERQLGYYHWVPIMMFLQAILFMLPNQFWHALNQQSGIEFIKFIEESTRLKHMELNNQERPSLVRELSERIAEGILQRDVFFRRRLAGCRVGSSMGSYVTLLYIGIKMLYLVNVVFQFLVLNTFIGTSYRFWGWEVLRALVNNENWQDSPIFPRLTLCDVPIRRLGDTPRYTLQCHLRINTYNEKIYLFIWWGFGVVAVLTFFNFLYYLIVFILPCTQENSVRHLLKQDRHESIVYSAKKSDKKLIKQFAEEALAKDGILLFWFIESHAGPIVAREILGEIFEYYKSKSHYEEDPDQIVTTKGKSSFSSQSTGSLNDDYDDWPPNGRFGNGATPSAPPKFPSGESASFSSSQERELIDGEGVDGTETAQLYASTPRGSRRANGGGGSARYKSRPITDYSEGKDNYRRSQPGFLTRTFRYLFGGGNAGSANNNYYRSQQPPLITPASYYGQKPMKIV